MLLTLVLLISMTSAITASASSDYLSGDWKKVKIEDGSKTFNVYAWMLDNTVYNCSSFQLTMDVTMHHNTKCYNWNVWVRSGGSFVKVGSVYLSSGTGYKDQTIYLSTAKTFDAVAVTPTASGGYSWTMSMGISDVKTKSASSYSSSSGSSSYSSSLRTNVRSGYSESVRLDSCTTSALVFYDPIYRCSQLSIELDITMKNNCHCEKWAVWGRNNGSFSKLDTIYLPGGDGKTTATLYFSNPRSFDAIAVTPIKNGGFSWSQSITVYDVK